MMVLETERLELRQLTLDDTHDLAEVLTDPQAMRYYPAPFTHAQTAGSSGICATMPSTALASGRWCAKMTD